MDDPTGAELTYYQRNKKRINEQCRRHYWKNPERARERARKWREQNKERALATDKAYYASNKDRILEKNRKYREKIGGSNPRRMAFQKMLMALKSVGPCAICGLRNVPEVMDFHHAYGKKSFNLQAPNLCGRSRREILEEYLKCVLLCANCHRRLHAGTASLPD